MTTHEDPMVTSHWTSGVRAPVTEEVTALDLAVTGVIPAELDGRFLRNGPNPIGAIDVATHHWFTGHGMVHGLRLRGGRAEWYRNRWVRTPDVTDLLGEAPGPSPYGDDVRLFSANTNVIGHGGRTLAICESGPPPVELTEELDTIGATDLDGTLEHAYSAHPKLDPATGELHSVAYHWAWGNKLQYQVVGADGRVRHTADIPTRGPVMVHDIAITETHAVVFELPVVFNLDAAMAGARLPYRWDSGYQARLGILPLGGTGEEVRWVEIDPCWVFHPANAYDVGDRLVLDVVRFDTVFNVDVTGPNDGASRLDRWFVDPVEGTMVSETIDDRGQEFPRVDERFTGRCHRSIFTAEMGDGFEPGAALRHDTARGTTERHDYGPGRTTGELVFVPRRDDAPADDGWVLSFVEDATTGTSDVVILDTDDFTGDPVATIHLPARVPVGFHGNWIPSSTSPSASSPPAG